MKIFSPHELSGNVWADTREEKTPREVEDARGRRWREVLGSKVGLTLGLQRWVGPGWAERTQERGQGEKVTFVLRWQ